LQTFLKEKGTLSLKEMTKAANDFYEAHGYPSDSHEPSKRPNDNMKQPTLNSVNHRKTQPPSVTHAGTRHCDNCGLNNHHTNECRRLPLNTVNHRNTQPPSVTHAVTRHCDNCGMNNHNPNECRRLPSSLNNTNSNIVCFRCNRPGHKIL